MKDTDITTRDLDEARQVATVFLKNQDKLEITLRERNLLAKSGSREFSHQNFFGKSPVAIELSRDATVALQTAINLSKEWVIYSLYILSTDYYLIIWKKERV